MKWIYSKLPSWCTYPGRAWTLKIQVGTWAYDHMAPRIQRRCYLTRSWQHIGKDGNICNHRLLGTGQSLLPKTCPFYQPGIQNGKTGLAICNSCFLGDRNLPCKHNCNTYKQQTGVDFVDSKGHPCRNACKSKSISHWKPLLRQRTRFGCNSCKGNQATTIAIGNDLTVPDMLNHKNQFQGMHWLFLWLSPWE